MYDHSISWSSSTMQCNAPSNLLGQTNIDLKFIQEALCAHNMYRARHSAAPLQHDINLSLSAQVFHTKPCALNLTRHIRVQYTIPNESNTNVFSSAK